MQKYFPVFLLVILYSLNIFSQNDIPPKREFRAVWIATVLKLDWPQSSVPSVQQKQFISMLDNLKGAGINAVIVQVRPSCDAFYPSGFEPWSEWLTNKQGLPPDPFYDPLLFMINETHKRGMEFHAWFNPFRAVFSTTTSSVHPSHVSVQHPEWIVKYGTKKILNPGLPQVRDYIVKVVMDVVRRYDIDGVHFDDYFYPYPEKGQVFDDGDAFKRFSRGINDIGDWRRDNVNLFVSMVYDSIIAAKPYIKFGISPFGKWKPEISTGFSGFSSYSDIYCDPVVWLKKRDVDYIAPQLYWRNENVTFNQVKKGYGYLNLMTWWSQQLNGRHFFTGNAIYKITPGEGDWPASEVLTQIEQNRLNPGVGGNIQFRAEFFINNIKGYRDSLINNHYKYPALPPVMNWKDSIPPMPVKNVTAMVNSSDITLRWDKPDTAPDGDTGYSYIIYRFDNNAPVNIDDPRFIKKIEYSGSNIFYEPYPFNKEISAVTYVINALDRLHNESSISSITLNSSGVIQPDIFMYSQKQIELKKEYLNTFDQPAEITFQIQLDDKKNHAFTLTIFNVYGNEVALFKHYIRQPDNRIIFKVSNLVSGVYISRLMDNGKKFESKIFTIQ